MKHTSLEDIVALTKKFIHIRSIEGNHQELNRILECALAEVGDFTIEQFERNGVKSALVYTAPTRPERFDIILNGHLDVIPGKDEQYEPREEGGRIYGVGSMDMKANVACLIAAFRDVAHMSSKSIALQLVTDEEVGGFDGTKLQVERGVRGDFVLAGEPTNFDIVHKAKGVLWLRITTRGATAHGAYPWRGTNAIWGMHEFLARLKERYPIPQEQVWQTTLNLSTIGTSNTAYNKIPDACVVGLDIRFVPEDTDTVVESVRTLLPKEAEIEILANEPALFTDQDDAHVLHINRIASQILGKEIVLRYANGTSDARHYRAVGCPGIEFGPVGGGIGEDDEWVDIASLEQYYRILVRFLTETSA